MYFYPRVSKRAHGCSRYRVGKIRKGQSIKEVCWTVVADYHWGNDRYWPYIISDEGFREPQSYRDVFKVLAENMILPGDELPQYENIASFRNILVHHYGKIDDSIVYGIFRNNLKDIEEYVAYILSWVEKNGQESKWRASNVTFDGEKMAWNDWGFLETYSGREVFWGRKAAGWDLGENGSNVQYFTRKSIWKTYWKSLQIVSTSLLNRQTWPGLQPSLIRWRWSISGLPLAGA